MNKLERVSNTNAKANNNKTIWNEIEKMKELEEIIQKNSLFKKYIKNDFDSDFEDSEEEEKDSDRNLEQLNEDNLTTKKKQYPHENDVDKFKKYLLQDIHTLKNKKLGNILLKTQAIELKKYLFKNLEKKKDYLELIYSDLEILLKNFDTYNNSKKKKYKTKIERKLKKLKKKKKYKAFRYLFKKYENIIINEINIEPKIYSFLKYSETQLEKLDNPKFQNFKIILRKKNSNFNFFSSPKILFEESLEHPDFTEQLLDKIYFQNFFGNQFFHFLLAFNEIEKFKLIENLCSFFSFNVTIDLKFFNQVNISHSLERGNEIFKELAQPDFNKKNVLFLLPTKKLK